MRNWLQRCFDYLRQVSGDDAYERYLAHHRRHHADQAVLDRRAFYLAEQRRKWSGVKRCC
ncbi:MAG: YbdD/YjiX family protein [Steroidobacteraceae bacterium]